MDMTMGCLNPPPLERTSVVSHTLQQRLSSPADCSPGWQLPMPRPQQLRHHLTLLLHLRTTARCQRTGRKAESS